MYFSISDVKTYIFLPPLVSFVISFFASMGGVSGAFLILPFQMSVLGFTSPSVSATNFLYNVVGIPGGVYRYIREGRMFWPLTWVFIAGTMPGILIGYYFRVRYFPDPSTFQLFVGIVLFYITVRLVQGALHKSEGIKSAKTGNFQLTNVTYKKLYVSYSFLDKHYAFNMIPMFILAFVVGIVGGIYGIGGGAIIAPVCVTFFKLPVYTVAGAALTGTFITSIIGVISYSLIPLNNGLTAPPDWWLGILFGLGGLPGMYLGAKVQKHMSERIIKAILALFIFFVSGKYILQYFC
jgi:uncharacterized membrane protein YfcA